MGNYEQLIAAIEQVIKTNGNNEITGALLQSTLKSIVNSIGANATFAGVATPATNPGTPDQNEFYIAGTQGNYVNFNNISVSSGELALLRTESGQWIKNSLYFASITDVRETYMTNMFPADSIILPVKGTKGTIDIFAFDLTKNGWYVNTPSGATSSGEGLQSRAMPIRYNENSPHELVAECVVTYTKGAQVQHQPFIQILDRKLTAVSSINMTAEAMDDNADGNSRVFLRAKIDLKQVAEGSGGLVTSGMYIIPNIVIQFSIGSAIPTGFTLYIESRRLSFVGLEDMDLRDYAKERARIYGKSVELPAIVTNMAYSIASVRYNTQNQNGLSFEPNEAFIDGGAITFDINIPLLQKWIDEFGKAFLLRIRMSGENVATGSNITTMLDSYVIKANILTSAVCKLLYIDPSRMELLIKVYASSIGGMRLFVPFVFERLDDAKSASMKIDGIALMQYNADMLSDYFNDWAEAKSLNDGKIIDIIDDWAKNTERFPLKAVFGGEGFNGGENNAFTGCLSVPRGIEKLNPNYVCAYINKDVFKSMVCREISGQRAVGVSWFVMYKIKGYGVNGKDDYYYNSDSFVGDNAYFTGEANANNITPIASAKYVHFIPQPLMSRGNEEPYFIVQYEYYFPVDADVPADVGIQLFAMMNNVPALQSVDIIAQPLSVWAFGLDFPVEDNQLSRALKYAQYADNVIGFPQNLKLATGELSVYLTETKGAVLLGNSGTADKTSEAISGYIGLTEVAQNEGAIVSIYINSSVAQTVDFVVAKVDQNNVVIPGVKVEGIELVAGVNILSYYNLAQSPLPIKQGERLFVLQHEANGIPYMDKEGSSYIYASNISNPVISSVGGRQLDFRYIIQYKAAINPQIPNRQDFDKLASRVDTLLGDNTAIPIYSPDGSKWYIRVKNDGSVYAERNTFSKLCIIGNSITLHGITDYWWGEWGMAATKRENDYAHLILKQAQKGNPACSLDYFNFSAWETATTSEERTALLPQYLDEHLALNPDCVIIRLCENIQPAGTSTLQQDYQALLQYVKSKVPTAKIFCGGSFWPAADKDARIAAACAAEGVSFSYQSQLDTPENCSAIGTQVYGDDGSWHSIDNEGVASHPGDKGMQAIADIFIKQMEI